MHCPVCKDPQLVMTERQGVEIDYCPQCRGVWLDRGELDKLIDKSVSASAPQPFQGAQPPAYEPRHDPRYDSRYSRPPSYHKKQKSWLSEFFD